ncbi:MAG TPA: hypothetical protein PKC28_11225 [Bdellovibrionales bacterium]|nr:hypothetical protein [Bdellovibrionales bacterium]
MDARLLTTLLISLLFMAGKAGAHGEDKPGPNRGFIRMPGAFHAELVPVNAKVFRVYLLDVHFKNPTTRNSKVELSQGDPAKCAAEEDHFVCEFAKANGTEALKLRATREGQAGHAVTYELPLRH